MLLVCLLVALFSGIKVVFLYSVPHIFVSAPQSEGCRVYSTVVTGNCIFLKLHIGNIGKRLVLVHKRINSTCHCNPSALYKSFVKGSAVKAFVPCYHLFAKGWIVLHFKVKIKCIFNLPFLYPFTVKPVTGILRVAVKPKGTALHRASGK